MAILKPSSLVLIISKGSLLLLQFVSTIAMFITALIQALEKRKQLIGQSEKENASRLARKEKLEKLPQQQQQLIAMMQKEMKAFKPKLRRSKKLCNEKLNTPKQ